MSLAVTIPKESKGEKVFYEIGFAPRAIGTMVEMGLTKSTGFEAFVLSTGFLVEAGEWWGNFLYDLLHPKEKPNPCE